MKRPQPRIPVKPEPKEPPTLAKSRRRPEVTARLRSEYRQRREARKAIRESTGVRNPITLQNLLREADERGMSYDEVDWDLIQGRDLSLTERRAILSETYGPTGREQLERAAFYEREQAELERERDRPARVSDAQARAEAQRFMSGFTVIYPGHPV